MSISEAVFYIIILICFYVIADRQRKRFDNYKLQNDLDIFNLKEANKILTSEINHLYDLNSSLRNFVNTKTIKEVNEAPIGVYNPKQQPNAEKKGYVDDYQANV